MSNDPSVTADAPYRVDPTSPICYESTTAAQPRPPTLIIVSGLSMPMSFLLMAGTSRHPDDVADDDD